MPPQASPCNFPESGQLLFMHPEHGELTVSRGLAGVLVTQGPGPLDKFTAQAEQWAQLFTLLDSCGYRLAFQPAAPIPAAPVSPTRTRCTDSQQEHRAHKHWAPPRPRERYARPT